MFRRADLLRRPASLRRREPQDHVAVALARAAIDGRLPLGFGVKRLMDLPLIWPDQWTALGLAAPAKT